MLQIIEDLVQPDLHLEASEVCTMKHWYFGQTSQKGGLPFWKMDLEGDALFDRIWEQARPRCESLVGAALRVGRQYANGNTFGLGGEPHNDDDRPGFYTLLYYPMKEWKNGWDGETVFYDDRGDIALAVLPRPNRAIFFDSRIRHVGHAPSRSCQELRVTIAYKLETAVWEDLRREVRASARA